MLIVLHRDRSEAHCESIDILSKEALVIQKTIDSV